jgi:hypothetical protein
VVAIDPGAAGQSEESGPTSHKEIAMFFNLIRRFLIAAVAVPLAAAGARKLSTSIEKRRGASRTTRALREGADFLQGFRRPKKRRFSFGR